MKIIIEASAKEMAEFLRTAAENRPEERKFDFGLFLKTLQEVSQESCRYKPYDTSTWNRTGQQ